MLLGALSQRLKEWQDVFAQRRTHQRAVVVGMGLLCGLGQRTITRALTFLGWGNRDWSANYKLFSRSPWKAEDLFVPVLREALQEWIPEEGPIAMATDDTAIRRTGKKITTASWQRDPMSPPFHVNLQWGQRFLQASLLLPLYRSDGQSSPRAIPVSFSECPVPKRPGRRASPEKQAEYRQARKQHNLSQCFVEQSRQLRAQLDQLGYAQRTVHQLGDGSYCNRTTFRAELERTVLTCRARKDLRLCFRHEGPGRRYYSEETFTPQDIYSHPDIPWQEVVVFHGGARRRVQFKEVTDVLWQRGGGKKTLRLIVLRERNHRKGKAPKRYRRKRAYLLSTDLTTAVKTVIQQYFDRFEIEFNHRDEKDILGVGQAQVWSKLSVPRVPEFMVAMYSLLLLSALAAYGTMRTDDYLPLPKWRRQSKRASCQDLINLLRQQIHNASQAAPAEKKISGFAQMVLQSAA